MAMRYKLRRDVHHPVDPLTTLSYNYALKLGLTDELAIQSIVCTDPSLCYNYDDVPANSSTALPKDIKNEGKKQKQEKKVQQGSKAKKGKKDDDDYEEDEEDEEADEESEEEEEESEGEKREKRAKKLKMDVRNSEKERASKKNESRRKPTTVQKVQKKKAKITPKLAEDDSSPTSEITPTLPKDLLAVGTSIDDMMDEMNYSSDGDDDARDVQSSQDVPQNPGEPLTSFTTCTNSFLLLLYSQHKCNANWFALRFAIILKLK